MSTTNTTAVAHTPGPWTVAASGTPGGASVVHGLTTIASAAKLADARVIAATPRMLAALRLVEPMAKSLMGELGKGPAADWGLINTALVEVGRAIAEAEGRA